MISYGSFPGLACSQKIAHRVVHQAPQLRKSYCINHQLYHIIACHFQSTTLSHIHPAPQVFQHQQPVGRSCGFETWVPPQWRCLAFAGDEEPWRATGCLAAVGAVFFSGETFFPQECVVFFLNFIRECHFDWFGMNPVLHFHDCDIILRRMCLTCW